MSELPEGWAWSTIGNVAEVNPAMSKSELSDDDPVSFVPMASVAVESGLIDTSDVRPAGPLKKKSFRQFADGDVVVAKITPSMENGKGAVARGLAGGRGFGSTEFHVLRPLAVAADYLLQFVLQPSFRADAARNMTGTAGQLRVPPDYLRDRPIPIPPLREQRRIVVAIEEHFSSADAAVLAAAKAAARADQLESLVEQELVSGNFEISGLEDLAQVTVDCLHSTPKFVRKGRVCLDTNAMSPGRIDRALLRFVDDATFHERNRRLVPQAGDVVFAREGSAAIGFAVVVPDDLEVCLGQRVMLIRPTHSISSDYIEAVLNSRFVRAQYSNKIRGSAAPHLNMSDIRSLRIPVPPRKEQDRIVEAVRDCRASFERLANGFRRVEQRAAALRRSVLAAAFSGQLVPRDPFDEPASVLLGRIAAERAAAKPSRRKKKAAS